MSGLFNEDGTQTRSGLFFEALRLIEATRPKIAIAENVKNLVGKKFKDQFEIVLKSLEEAGYTNYWQVLNAKDYGIPQNRERVFIVSIRNDVNNGSFTFPTPIPLELKLNDMLEDEFDEKYFISDAMMDYFLGVNQRESKYPRKERFLANINRADQSVATCISTNAGNRPVDNFIKYRNGELTHAPFFEGGDQ